MQNYILGLSLEQHCTTTYCYTTNRASDNSRKKNEKFAGFSGANLRKNRPNSRDFRGKKVKIRGKIGRFRRILAEKIRFKGFSEANS